MPILNKKPKAPKVYGLGLKFITKINDKSKHALLSVNGYLQRLLSTSKTVDINELGFTSFSLLNLAEEGALVSSKGLEYFPILINYRPNTGRLQRPFVYIQGAGRTSVKYLKEKLLNIFKEHFKGYHIHNLNDRYLFLIDELNIQAIQNLLKIAKKGDGSTIHYSWIAPLQELVFKNYTKGPFKNPISSDNTEWVDLSSGEDIINEEFGVVLNDPPVAYTTPDKAQKPDIKPGKGLISHIIESDNSYEKTVNELRKKLFGLITPGTPKVERINPYKYRYGEPDF